MANSPLTFSSSSTCDFSAVSHICSTVIELKIAEKGFARPTYGWIDHPLEQHRVCVEIFRIGGAQRHRDAHDLAHSDAPPLPCQLVAASRAAHALEDLGVNRPLQQRLKVA